MDSSSPSTGPSRRIYLNQLPADETLYLDILHANIATALAKLNFSPQTSYEITTRNTNGFIQISLHDEDAYQVAVILNSLPIILPDTHLLANVPKVKKGTAASHKPALSLAERIKKDLIRETRKRQKLRKRTKRFDRLAIFFCNIPPPGGNLVHSLYKNFSATSSSDVITTEDYLEGKGFVDWSHVPRSVDPGYNYLTDTPLGDNPLIESRHTLAEENCSVAPVVSDCLDAIIDDKLPAADHPVMQNVTSSNAFSDVIGRSSALITKEGQYQGFTTRAVRKRAQAESFVLILRSLLSILSENATDDYDKQWHIVDFGSGSGNLSLVLAYLFPDCTFTAVDMKEKSIEILKQRAAAAGLTNINAVVGRIEDFNDRFDVSLALHACGIATDHALQKAKRSRAAYVVCPCCVGNLKYAPEVSNHETVTSKFNATNLDRPHQTKEIGDMEENDSILHPRSKWLKDLLIQSGAPFELYTSLVRAGDIAHGSAHSNMQGNSHTHEAIARLCKSHIELDRNMNMEEAGYCTALMRILLSQLTGKGDLLVGIPDEWIQNNVTYDDLPSKSLPLSRPLPWVF